MPTETAAVEGFLDREAATAAVSAYADALDAHDWSAYRALFCDQVIIDYGAIGSLVATIPASEWVDRCRALEGFDATAHRLNNLTATIKDDSATVTSIVDAAHFVTIDQRILLADLIGRYTHYLRREGGWKIAGVTLTLVGYPAGHEAFDTAFAAARTIHAERNSR
ncbi:nuclear transport factor 2 family protein [uncultured Parasphingorhabdus sp.]|uniref:nuclear transport factor 2 family protein n=1 Tax=uncultured Parasphingorhabdus sp. TaxID=2709694 RepID=UPI0030DBABBD|tara:strand:- start:50363 stop:50860 length:498 start_codon:yes stop_codon:yes gene_type:complete